MTDPRARAAAVTAATVVILVAVILAVRSTGRPEPDPVPDVAQPDEPRPAVPPSSDPGRYDEKLVYRPTPLPDRIILTWTGDPATTQAVTWRTDVNTRKPVAQLAPAEGGPGFDPVWGKGKSEPNRLRTVPAVSQPLKTAINEARYHTANFDGLTPKTKYVYRVGDGDNWSEWFQFETASREPEPFGFIYFGDAQNGIKTLWSRVARGAYSDLPKARFIAHAGDLVDSGSSDTQWGEWHTAAGWINGMVPSVPTPGNHEYSGQKGLTAHWRAQFALPEHGPAGLQESCYFLDYQGVRVISLNSNEKHAEQAAWLERVLADNPNRWTVVTFHHPVYSPAPGRDNPRVREAWRPVFDRAPKGVDLVLQGHDHTYGRSGLMREDNTLSGTRVHTERGTVYAVSVSGAKLYSVGDKSWMVRKASGLQLYQLIRVDGERLTYEARTASGDLYDAFELRKRPDGGNELVEGEVPLPPEVEAAPGPTGPAVSTPAPGRDYWAAAAAVVILAAVGLGVGWAIRAR